MSSKILSVLLKEKLENTYIGGERVLGSSQINVPEHKHQSYYTRGTSFCWLVEAGGEDYGDYKIARFDLYSAGADVLDENSSPGLWRVPYWIKNEGWKICRLGDFDIYSMTCTPPRFVRQINDSRQLRAITITIKYNERSD